MSLRNLDPLALFDASPNPYLVLDRRLHIAGANKAYLAETKRELADIVGRWAWDAFPTDPQTLEQSIASFERVIRTKQPDTMALLRFDIPRPEAEGGGFEKRYWSITHIPILGADGEVEFVMQHPIDVTELERLRQVVQAAEGEQPFDLDPAVTGIFNRAQSVYEANLLLKADSDRLNTLLAQSPSPICVLAGKDHVYEIANEAYFQLAGRRDIMGKPLLEVLPELARQGINTLLDEVFNTGTPYVSRGRRVDLQQKPDSPLTALYHDVLYQPLLGPDGKVTAIFCQLNDVTDAYHAQDALRESQERVQQEMRRQAFQLELADRIRPLSNLEEVTAAACEVLGKYLGAKRVMYGEVDDRGETIGINRDWTDGTLTSMAGVKLRLDDFGPLVIDVLRAGRILAIDDVAVNEHSAPYADAYAANNVRSYLNIPLMKSARLQVILNVVDTAVHHWTDDEIAMANDMVDRTWFAIESIHETQKRQEAEDKLREKAVHLQFILEAAQIGEVVIDPATGANTRSLQHDRCFGYTEPMAEWNPEIFFEHIHPDDRQYVAQAFQTALAELKNWHAECRVIWPDKSVHWIALHGSFYLTKDKPTLMIGIVIDITERKQAEEKLRETDRRKDEFLAMLAHELRNPLAPIGAAAELLQVAKLDEARVRQTSEIIGRQVEHMTNLVNDLLDVSRVTRGLVELGDVPLDIRQVVADAVEQVTPLIQSRHHHLALHLPPKTPMVRGDKKRLVQVIANILNNAAKYTDEGGDIVLKTHVRESHILIEAIDKARAFDLFAQAERTSDRSLGGLGLGLALVKSLVELHGGTVSCESEGVGKGSKFTVCLPRLLAEERSVEGQGADSTLQQSRNSLRILVVDDNVDAAAMLAMLLETSGHQVVVEHGARAALERAKEAAPDVCLLDIGLPEMDGNELAQRLRTDPKTANAVLIAVTGYGQKNDRKHTPAAGFDHHLVKPVDTKRLASILAEIRKR